MRLLIAGICIMTMILTILRGGVNESKTYQSFPELRGSYLGQVPPGNKAKVFCDGFLKPPGGGFHSSITFSPDMKEAYWTAMGGRTFCSKMENGIWTIPAEIRFDSDYSIGEVTLSSNGTRLYFISRRPQDQDAFERERIWYSDRKNGTWSSPKAVDKEVCEHPTHWQFSLADNGNLYFTSEIEGVKGQQDIYFARWDGHRFMTPVDLGMNINSDVRDFTPFVAPDESYLIFARSVPEENNRSDLFISFKDKDGNWMKAVNMGDDINSLHNEVCPMVTPDGKYLFYLSISSERNDIYWISAEIINSLKS